VNRVYDTAVFVAAERHDRTIWADHRARLVSPAAAAPMC
jgi:hypothetical protein